MSMITDITSKAKLNNGLVMPYLGLGTWNLKDKQLEQTVKWALEFGYRHFDTATLYRNEKELGTSLKNFDRTELFITTKVWYTDFGYNSTLKACKTSLNKLQMKYVDQYLIHWPKSKKLNQDTWKALLKLFDEGKCKSIGVSNFSIEDLEDLKEMGDLIPVTNQIRLSPWDYNSEIMDYCKSEGILLVAYSPLNEGRGLNNKILFEIAKNNNKSSAQICLRWNLDHGAITIPKTSNKERLIENSHIFDFKLNQSEIEKLNSFSIN